MKWNAKPDLTWACRRSEDAECIDWLSRGLTFSEHGDKISVVCTSVPEGLKKKSNEVKTKTCRLFTSADFRRLRKEWKSGKLGALRSQLRAYDLCTLQQRQFDMTVLYQTEATTSAVFLDFKLSSWIPRRLNFMYRRFGTPCPFHLHMWCEQEE